MTMEKRVDLSGIVVPLGRYNEDFFFEAFLGIGDKEGWVVKMFLLAFAVTKHPTGRHWAGGKETMTKKTDLLGRAGKKGRWV